MKYRFLKTYEWGDVQFGVQIDGLNIIGETTAKSLYTDRPHNHSIEAEYLRFYGYPAEESEVSDFMKQFVKDLDSGKVSVDNLYTKSYTIDEDDKINKPSPKIRS